MEEKKTENGDIARKNFLKPEIHPDEILKKREEFAISLRKMKKKEIIN